MIRKLMMGMAAVVAFGVTACKNNREAVQDERRDVAEAQTEASQDIARAEQEARTDVAEENKAAQEQLAETRKDAQEKVAGEREDLTEAQQKLAEDQGVGGSGAAGAAMTVTGKLTSTLGSQLKLKTADGKTMDLKEDDRTVVMHNNSPVKLDSFDEGTEVRASYVTEGSEKIAREVTIVTPVQKK